MGKAKRSTQSDQQQTGLLPLETRLGVDIMETAPADDPPDRARLILGPVMLPIPPSANRYWKILMLPTKGLDWPILVASVRDIWKYFRSMQKLSDEAEYYKNHIGELFLQMENRPRMSVSPLCIEIVVCFATKAKQDIDNRVKPLLDALQAARVMEDDSQIVELRVRRGPVIKDGRVVIRIWEVIPDYDRALFLTGWGGGNFRPS